MKAETLVDSLLQERVPIEARHIPTLNKHEKAMEAQLRSLKTNKAEMSSVLPRHSTILRELDAAISNLELALRSLKRFTTE